MKRILFVCTGNTCRSAMAQGISSYLADKLSSDVVSESCGISTIDGLEASENAVLALKELYGIDISSHRSRALSDEAVQNADLIFCMAGSHYDVLRYYYPEYKDKLVCAEPEISDPYMHNLEVYKTCAREIYAQIEKLISEDI